MNPLAYAVASVLPGEAHAATLAIWKQFEQHYGLRGAQVAVHPHITYVVGTCATPHLLAGALSDAVAGLAPVDAIIDGVGVFENAAPVVYLRVLPSEALTKAHSAIVTALSRVGMQLWEHYLPGVWVPHVTVAFRDTTSDLLPTLLRDLEAHDTRHSVRLDSASLVRIALPDVAFVNTFALGG